MADLKSSVTDNYAPWAVPKTTTSTTPNPIPIPTPNPGAGSGSGLPTAVQYDVLGQSWTNEPSWDWQRFGNDPTTAASSQQAQSNLASNINQSTNSSPVNTSTPSTPSTGGLTAQILQSKFGFTDPNVISNILNNPSEKARYETEMYGSGSSGTDQSSRPSDDQIKQTYRDKTGVELDTAGLNEIKGLLDSGFDLDSAASKKEASERGVAEEIYNAAMDVLRQQKEQLPATAEYQKGRVKGQLDLDLEDISSSRGRDVGDIQRQQSQFETKYEQDQNTLADNWRSLSLHTQAIARARGITSSDFAAQNESKQAMEFNKGLRALATSSQSALTEFMSAISNTNEYYTRAEARLKADANARMEDIDQWLQQSVVGIQQQERLALGDKLAQIKQAAANAQQFKDNYMLAQQQRQQALEDWLMQTKVNFDNSMKMAAAGNIAAAKTSIADIKKTSDLMWDQFTKGGASLVSDTSGKSYLQTATGGLPGVTYGEDGYGYYPVQDPQQASTYLENYNKAPQGWDALKNTLLTNPS